MELPVFATKGDYAYTNVRQLILSTELAPGSVIDQRALAARIGVSTTPLREALRRLESEGWVQLDAHSRARISPLTAAEARDLYEVRSALEPYAARLAAERRTDADIAAMQAAAQQLQPLIGGVERSVLIVHRAFHAAIQQASHNVLLITMLDTLWDKADRYRHYALELVDPAESRLRDYQEHFDLMQAVIDGDATAAESLMRGHVSASVTAHLDERIG